MVVQFCKEKGIEPFRVSALFSHFLTKKLKNGRITKNVAELEENVKWFFENQYYLNVLLKTTESIVDSVSEYNLERNNNSQIFMNELL